MSGARRPVRCLLGLVAVALLSTSCSIPQDAAPRQINQRSVPVDLTDPKRNVELFFVRGDSPSLSKVQRSIPLQTDIQATVRDTITQLRMPLTSEEAALGLRSELPTVEFSADVRNRIVVELAVPDGSRLLEDGTLLGQIVLTMTGLGGIESVDVLVRGNRAQRVRGPNGEELIPPLTEKNFDILLRRQEVAKLYFVRNGLLEPVDRVVDAIETLDDPDLAAEKYLGPLVDGPTPEQAGRGYSSLLPRAPALAPALLCRTGVVPLCESYTLDFPTEFDELTVAEQSLAIGQTLYTLDGWRRASVGKVVIQVGGVRRRLVPLPRGKTTSGPVDKTMYRSLLANQN